MAPRSRIQGKKFLLTTSDLPDSAFGQDLNSQIDWQADMPDHGKDYLEHYLDFFEVQCGYKGIPLLEAMVGGLEIAPTTGLPHVHIFVMFRDKVRGPMDIFDIPCQKHPNIVVPNTISGTVKYVIKGGCYIEGPDGVIERLLAMSTNEATKGDRVFGDYITGKRTLYELLKAEPGYAGMHSGKLKAAKHEYDEGEKAQYVYPRFGDAHCITISTNMRERTILFDILSQALVDPPERFGNNAHLWLVAGTGCGKTRLKTYLARFFPIFEINHLNNWQDGFTNKDMIYCVDEFNGQLSPQVLNRWMDPAPQTIQVRGASLTRTVQRFVIIFSNYTIDQCYHKLYAKNPDDLGLAGIHRRVTEVNFGNDSFVAAMEDIDPAVEEEAGNSSPGMCLPAEAVEDLSSEISLD